MASEVHQAKDIFLKLADRVPPDDWESCLDDECAGNGTLKNRVRALLQAHAHPSTRFSEDALAVTLQMECESATDGVGKQIGPYKLLEVIGEGGMGTVYMAEQTEPVHRKVALKLIKTGHGHPAGDCPLRSRAAGAGADGPSEHRQGPRRRRHRFGAALFRDGAGQRRADHRVL